MSFVALHCCSDVTNTTQSLCDQAQDTGFTNRRNILHSHLSHFQINIVRYGRSTGQANTVLTSGHHTQDFTSKHPRFTFLVTGDRFGRSRQAQTTGQHPRSPKLIFRILIFECGPKINQKFDPWHLAECCQMATIQIRCST